MAQLHHQTASWAQKMSPAAIRLQYEDRLRQLRQHVESCEDDPAFAESVAASRKRIADIESKLDALRPTMDLQQQGPRT